MPPPFRMVWISEFCGELRVEARARASGLRANRMIAEEVAANCTARCAVHRGAPLKAQLSAGPPCEKARLLPRLFAWYETAVHRGAPLKAQLSAGPPLQANTHRVGGAYLTRTSPPAQGAPIGRPLCCGTGYSIWTTGSREPPRRAKLCRKAPSGFRQNPPRFRAIPARRRKFF